ncbi:L,D-transpeptidase family protein [Mycobacterium sp. AMU20-3851]|uniref:L,D-transpeptidase family protein n=1 Tax=Mycobacterium sp. AMU20-3851 TaxID=3122055 RepID=UPI003753EB31
MRRLVLLLSALWLACAAPVPVVHAAETPWFVNSVGGATQVVSVVGVGATTAKIDVWERTAAGWNPIGVGIPAHIGSNGMAQQIREGSKTTPMGVFTLDFAFGTQGNPGGGLPYVQVGPNHWWDGDVASPTYNTMQVCEKERCPFRTDGGGTENLQIPQYAHAVVMGVNKARTPGAGSAFFLHSTGGGPTAGCVAIDDATLVEIIRWLRPGAVMAVSK